MPDEVAHEFPIFVPKIIEAQQRPSTMSSSTSSSILDDIIDISLLNDQNGVLPPIVEPLESNRLLTRLCGTKETFEALLGMYDRLRKSVVVMEDILIDGDGAADNDEEEEHQYSDEEVYSRHLSRGDNSNDDEGEDEYQDRDEVEEEVEVEEKKDEEEEEEEEEEDEEDDNDNDEEDKKDEKDEEEEESEEDEEEEEEEEVSDNNSNEYTEEENESKNKQETTQYYSCAAEEEKSNVSQNKETSSTHRENNEPIPFHIGFANMLRMVLNEAEENFSTFLGRQAHAYTEPEGDNSGEEEEGERIEGSTANQSDENYEGEYEDDYSEVDDEEESEVEMEMEDSKQIKDIMQASSYSRDVPYNKRAEKLISQETAIHDQDKSTTFTSWGSSH